jgi:hypothetical protein
VVLFEEDFEELADGELPGQGDWELSETYGNCPMSLGSHGRGLGTRIADGSIATSCSHPSAEHVLPAGLFSRDGIVRVQFDGFGEMDPVEHAFGLRLLNPGNSDWSPGFYWTCHTGQHCGSGNQGWVFDVPDDWKDRRIDPARDASSFTPLIPHLHDERVFMLANTEAISVQLTMAIVVDLDSGCIWGEFTQPDGTTSVTPSYEIQPGEMETLGRFVIYNGWYYRADAGGEIDNIVVSASTL